MVDRADEPRDRTVGQSDQRESDQSAVKRQPFVERGAGLLDRSERIDAGFDVDDFEQI